MSEAEKRALEKYPPKYIAETWVRKPADVNIPLRRAFVEGYNDANSKNDHTNLNNSKL